MWRYSHHGFAPLLLLGVACHVLALLAFDLRTEEDRARIDTLRIVTHFTLSPPI